MRRGAKIGIVVLMVFTFLSLIAPLTGLFDSESIQADKVLAGPEPAHPLGYDATGRDILSRLLYAYRSSLFVALGSVTLALLAGSLIGVLAGFYRGSVDMVAMRPVDIMLAFPAVLMAVTLIAILGRSSLVVLVAIAVIYTPIFARAVRSSVLAIASLSYVDAARCRGSRDWRTIFRHVLPNSLGPAIVLASVLAGVALQIEAALSFIGLGAQPPTPSLGVMLAEGREFISTAPMVVVFPGIAIIVTVAAFLAIGDGLRARLDPRGIAS